MKQTQRSLGQVLFNAMSVIVDNKSSNWKNCRTKKQYEKWAKAVVDEAYARLLAEIRTW